MMAMDNQLRIMLKLLGSSGGGLDNACAQKVVHM